MIDKAIAGVLFTEKNYLGSDGQPVALGDFVILERWKIRRYSVRPLKEGQSVRAVATEGGTDFMPLIIFSTAASLYFANNILLIIAIFFFGMTVFRQLSKQVVMQLGEKDAVNIISVARQAAKRGSPPNVLELTTAIERLSFEDSSPEDLPDVGGVNSALAETRRGSDSHGWRGPDLGLDIGRYLSSLSVGSRAEAERAMDLIIEVGEILKDVPEAERAVPDINMVIPLDEAMNVIMPSMAILNDLRSQGIALHSSRLKVLSDFVQQRERDTTPDPSLSLVDLRKPPLEIEAPVPVDLSKPPRVFEVTDSRRARFRPGFVAHTLEEVADLINNQTHQTLVVTVPSGFDPDIHADQYGSDHDSEGSPPWQFVSFDEQSRQATYVR